MTNPQADSAEDTDFDAQEDSEFEDQWNGFEEAEYGGDPEDSTANLVEGFSGASYDVLAIVSALENMDKPSEFEIHTFSYLACLLYVFEGKPASSWGYLFSAVPPTLPFSATLSQAINELESSSLLMQVDEDVSPTHLPEHGGNLAVTRRHFSLTERGREEYAFLSTMNIMRTREKYLTAAVSTSLVFSVPAVLNSLIYEPQLWQAVQAQSPRALLVKITSKPLYDQFEALRSAVGDQTHHLSVPATVYIGYLDSEATTDYSALTSNDQDEGKGDGARDA